MSQGHALLWAIKEEPHDDLRRRVLADWLEEDGQPERAEFVRLQVERSHVPRYVPGGQEPGPRERQLLAEHEPQWLGFWSRLKPDTWKYRKFHRGLLQVQCQAKWLSGQLGKGKGKDALAWVEGLNLGGLWDEVLPVLRKPWLRQVLALGLFCYGEGQDEAPVAALASSPHLAHLASLDLRASSIQDAGAMVFASFPHPQLTSLALAHNSIGDAGASALASSPHLARLVSLDLSDNGLSAEGAAALVSSPHLARLADLDLGRYSHSKHVYPHGNEIGNAVAEALASSPQLARFHSLGLAGYFIDDAGAAVLASSPHLGPLTALDLSFNEIGDAGAEALASSPHLARLDTLDLGYNRIGAAGARALASSPYLAGLTSLLLERNHIGDAGAEALASSPHLAGLDNLDLADNGIAQVGAGALLSSPHLADLANLDLLGNAIGGQEKVLKRRFPRNGGQTASDWG